MSLPPQNNQRTVRCKLSNSNLHNEVKLLLKYFQIKQYNSSGADAVKQVEQSVSRLDNIKEKINETNSILNQDFYNNVKKNDETLEELSKVKRRCIF